ncbi:NACHT, LRR and PYD domains-containing protein 12-like [Mantella aurantiaca]
MAPDHLGKGQQTPGDLIINSLEDLTEYHFKKFRNKLSDFSYGDKCPIPKGRLENADWTTTKDVLMDTYGEEGALDVTTDVLTQIGLMGHANDLWKRRAENVKLKKMIHDNRITDIRQEYRECVKEMFLRIKEYNSGDNPGETVSLQKRYTKLLMRKGRQNKEDKEEEISCSGRRHLQTMKKRSSDEYSPTTIQALFDPDEDGFIPKIVVLQGPAGIGKTMTSKKIMLDWAKESLYKDKFDFVFYLSCREINTITGNINLVGLLSRTCKLQCSDDLVSILKDSGSHRKLLLIVDGFDELRWTVEEKSEDCFDIFGETHKEILLQRLLRKQIFSQSSLIITTRSLAMQKLNTFIDVSRNVEVLGFTGEDREEYVHKFFGNEEDADKVLSIIKGNDILYTMCAVPITCWIVCTVMKPKIKKDLGLNQCDTMTSIYLLYLEVLITHHSKKDQSVEKKPRAIHTCLRKLCALANEGILSQQILFEEQDLKRHGLSLSEVESVFLNKNIFHKDVRTQTCYSFIHLSVQEFFAALYYGLDDGFGFLKVDPECQKKLSPLLHRCQKVSFYGCTFQRRSEDILSDYNVEDTLKPANLSFLINPQSQIQKLSLYECDLTSSCCDVLRSILITNQSLITLDLSYNKLRNSGIKLLCEGLSNPHCILKELSLFVCGFTSSSCDDLCSAFITNRSLTGLYLSGNYLRDSGVKRLCEGLKHPDCTLQQLSPRLPVPRTQSHRPQSQVEADPGFCLGRGLE